MKTYECININKDIHFTFSEMTLTKMCIILATTYFVDLTKHYQPHNKHTEHISLTCNTAIQQVEVIK